MWSCNILSLLIFMMELRATSASDTNWTYDYLLLINSLKMVPWCRRNM